MGKTLVEIPVDEETAQLISSLPGEDRTRLQEALSALLREAARTPRRSAVEIAREAGQIARQNGLTPEAMNDLLDD